MIRIGQGWDLHRLVPERTLIIGGVEIPFEKGEDGHSDGDVLLHAVIDALLGAAGLGDIGGHFPPGNPRYKDISSRELLRRTSELLEDSGFEVVNLDSTVVLEQPRIAPYLQRIRALIGDDLRTGPDRISVKGKTAEKTGPVGRGEAIEAYAVCLIQVKQGGNGQ